MVVLDDGAGERVEMINKVKLGDVICFYTVLSQQRKGIFEKVEQKNYEKQNHCYLRFWKKS